MTSETLRIAGPEVFDSAQQAGSEFVLTGPSTHFCALTAVIVPSDCRVLIVFRNLTEGCESRPWLINCSRALLFDLMMS